MQIREHLSVPASVMMLWNRKYQEFDLVVSSVTTKVKGVAQTNLSGGAEVVWDVVDYSGPGAQVGTSALVDPRLIGRGGGWGLSLLLCRFRAKTPFLC